MRKFAQDTMSVKRFTPNKITQHILYVRLYTSESEGITHITHKLSLTYKTTIVDSKAPQLHPIWSLSSQDCSFPINSFLFYDNIPRSAHCREICRYPLFNRWLSWFKRLPSSTQVLWRKWVWLPLLSTDCWAVGPQVCSHLPTNWDQTGTVNGSFALKALIFLSVRMFKATIMIPEVCRHGHFPLYLDTLFNIAGHYMLFAIICCMLTCSKFSYKHHVSSVDLNPKKCQTKSTHNVQRIFIRPPIE